MLQILRNNNGLWPNLCSRYLFFMLSFDANWGIWVNKVNGCRWKTGVWVWTDCRGKCKVVPVLNTALWGCVRDIEVIMCFPFHGWSLSGLEERTSWRRYRFLPWSESELQLHVPTKWGPSVDVNCRLCAPVALPPDIPWTRGRMILRTVVNVVGKWKIQRSLELELERHLI
jgi:hypothetical protein